jgi:integrase/recombinase XerD
MSTDSTLARALHQFFLNYLPKQRSTSPHTVQSYRDSLKLLLKFVVNRVGVGAQLEVEHITVERILAFLEHLETARHNGASTRNVRLSAIHSFFRYLGAQYVQHLALSQRILGIPFKRTGSREIQHLEQSEIKAVVDGIDRSTSAGRRDYALLSLLFNSGARVSEVVALKARDFRLASPPHVMLRGKGRKERTCPLWTETANVLREYMEEQHIAPHDEAKSVFPNQCGQPLTRFGIRFIVKKHVHNAAAQMPCLSQAASSTQSPTQHGHIPSAIRSRLEHDRPLARTCQCQYDEQIPESGHGSQTGSARQSEATIQAHWEIRRLAKESRPCRMAGGAVNLPVNNVESHRQ